MVDGFDGWFFFVESSKGLSVDESCGVRYTLSSGLGSLNLA